MSRFILVFISSIFIFSVACQPEPKIVNGYEVAAIVGFQHQVSIREAAYDRSRFGGGHMCGGALIGTRTVLTAAHCVHDGKKTYFKGSKYVVAMGGLDRYLRTNTTVYIDVAEVRGHKKYNPKNFDNDIALLILVSDVPTNNSNVAMISLPTSSPTTGASCVISGWGTTIYDVSSSAPARLRAANLIVNSKSACNAKSSHNGAVLNGMFCAGSFTGQNIADSCQGDSGGPFTCNGIIVGITSNGVGCGVPNYPGVYIDVFHYKNWILAGDSSMIAANSVIISSMFFLSTWFARL